MDFCDEFNQEDFFKRAAKKDAIHTMNEYNWARAAYESAERNLVNSGIVVATLDGIFKRNDPEEIRNWRARITLV